MGKVSDLLSLSWIEARIAECRQAIENRTGREAAAHAIGAKLLADVAHPAFAAEKAGAAELPPVKTAMKWAALEHARGAGPEVVRGICRDIAAAWAAVVKGLDFTPREYVIEGGLQPSVAQRMIVAWGGEITRKGQYAGVRYTGIPQPHALEMPRVFMCAAVSGDRKLARELACSYKHLDPQQIDPVHKATVRETMLAYLLAEDDDRAGKLAAAVADGYAADWPPDRAEFPLGIVRRDPTLLLHGMKTITTRFMGMWDLKKHERWYAAQQKKPPRALRRLGSWENVLDQTRRSLVDQQWVLSWWALAFQNVARWRGMDEVFANSKAFSEWTPLTLC